MKELNERLLNIKSNMREKERLLKMLENAEKQKRVLEELVHCHQLSYLKRDRREARGKHLG